MTSAHNGITPFARDRSCPLPEVGKLFFYEPLAPHNDISGGKVLRSRTLTGGNRAGQAFRLAAQSVSRTQSAFGAFYCRLRAKHGPKKAIVATAHKIARTFYAMRKHRTPFTDIGAEADEQPEREREITRLQKRATKRGFTLVPPATQPA